MKLIAIRIQMRVNIFFVPSGNFVCYNSSLVALQKVIDLLSSGSYQVAYSFGSDMTLKR